MLQLWQQHGLLVVVRKLTCRLVTKRNPTDEPLVRQRDFLFMRDDEHDGSLSQELAAARIFGTLILR